MASKSDPRSSEEQRRMDLEFDSSDYEFTPPKPLYPNAGAASIEAMMRDMIAHSVAAETASTAAELTLDWAYNEKHTRWYNSFKAWWKVQQNSYG